MPSIAICANCQQAMTLGADMTGKEVRCPHCRMTFNVPSTSIADPQPPVNRGTESTDAGLVSKQPRDHRWATTAYLLRRIFVATIYHAIAAAMLLILPSVSEYQGIQAFACCFGVPTLVVTVVLLVSSLIQLALNTPAESGAQKYLLGSVACIGAIMIGFVFLIALSSMEFMRDMDPDTDRVVETMSTLVFAGLTFASVILFVFYLRAVCQHFLDVDLVARCMQLIYVASVSYVVGITLILLPISTMQARQLRAVIVALLIGVVVAFFLPTLHNVRTLIVKRTSPVKRPATGN